MGDRRKSATVPAYFRPRQVHIVLHKAGTTGGWSGFSIFKPLVGFKTNRLNDITASDQSPDVLDH
jgi:hypothetical protein